MIVTIDTDNKTIRTENVCNLGELMRFLQETFPDGEWRRYELHPGSMYPYMPPVNHVFNPSTNWGSSAPTLTNY